MRTPNLKVSSSNYPSKAKLPETGNRIEEKGTTKQTELGGNFTLPGTSIRVKRLGYGAMQLAGPGVWGPPRDVNAAIEVLREAVASGVNHIDTSGRGGGIAGGDSDAGGAGVALATVAEYRADPGHIFSCAPSREPCGC